MNKLIFAALAAVAVTLSGPALAQDKKPDTTKTEAKKVDIPADYWKKQKPTQYLVKDRLIGQQVKNKDGKIVGDIEDVIVGDENKVVGVIMGVGGFLGVGEKKVAVRYRALEFSAVDGKKVITLPSATKEVLAALLPYERMAPPKSLIEKAKDKAQELTEKGKDAAAAAKEKAGPALEKAKEAAKGAVDKAKELAAPKPAEPAAKP
jgi:PRC-barrel domain